MMAEHFSKGKGTKKRERWVDPVTAGTLRDMCGAVICILWASDESMPLVWRQLTERKIECRFGRIRSCFQNAQMSVGDFWRASLQLMRKDLDLELPPQEDCKHIKLTEKQFQSTASSAFSAARKLASLCSGLTDSELTAMFKMRTPSDDDLDAQTPTFAGREPWAFHSRA